MSRARLGNKRELNTPFLRESRDPTPPRSEVTSSGFNRFCILRGVNLLEVERSKFVDLPEGNIMRVYLHRRFDRKRAMLLVRLWLV